METISITSTCIEKAGDLLVIDTDQQGNPGIAKAQPGYHYLLPQTESIRPVFGVRAHIGGFDAPLLWNEKQVMDNVDLNYWAITLLDQRNAVLLRDFPLGFLYRWSLQKRESWFNGLRVDPRRSFITTGSIAANKKTCLISFIY